MLDVLIIGGGPHALTLTSLLTHPHPGPHADPGSDSPAPLFCSQPPRLHTRPDTSHNKRHGAKKREVVRGTLCGQLWVVIVPTVPLLFRIFIGFSFQSLYLLSLLHLLPGFYISSSLGCDAAVAADEGPEPISENVQGPVSVCSLGGGHGWGHNHVHPTDGGREERLLRLQVVDACGRWADLWRSQFTALSIPHLRSHALVHTDPHSKVPQKPEG